MLSRMAPSSPPVMRTLHLLKSPDILLLTTPPTQGTSDSFVTDELPTIGSQHAESGERSLEVHPRNPSRPPAINFRLTHSKHRIKSSPAFAGYFVGRCRLKLCSDLYYFFRSSRSRNFNRIQSLDKSEDSTPNVAKIDQNEPYIHLQNERASNFTTGLALRHPAQKCRCETVKL